MKVNIEGVEMVLNNNKKKKKSILDRWLEGFVWQTTFPLWL